MTDTQGWMAYFQNQVLQYTVWFSLPHFLYTEQSDLFTYLYLLPHLLGHFAQLALLPIGMFQSPHRKSSSSPLKL